MKINVLFDNVPFDSMMETGWGYSCLVSQGGFNLLFDTGAKWRMLHDNMKKAGVDPQRIDAVVISHNHWDHNGGLSGLLKIKEGLDVYIPASAYPTLGKQAEAWGGRVIAVNEPVEIHPGFLSTGELFGVVNEQSLVLSGDDSAMVITGCAHPGIVEIAAKANEVSPKPVVTAMGGFHLKDKGADELAGISKRLKELNLKYVAPSHCTGDAARTALKKAFGGNYIESGVGKSLRTEVYA